MSFPAEVLERRLLLSGWYVSVDAGSDLNPGTVAQPFQSIQRAASLAQPGDTVFMRGGTYRETVVPAHSGSAGQPIVFEPYQNEKVTIDGADPVGGWAIAAGSTCQTTMPWSMGDGRNQLFFDGQMMNEARWPNSSLDPSHPVLATVSSATTPVLSNGLATVTIGVPLTDPAGTWVGATIHIAPGAAWVTETGTVIASAPGTLTYQYQPLTAFEVPAAGNRFYLSGLFRMLDSAGEWYLDNAGTLSLWAPHGANPAGHTVELKRRLYAFDLSGKSYVDIIGLNLSGCTINTDSSSNNIRLDGINARYLSQQTLNANPWYDQNHPHTQGIIFNGANDVIENSTIDYSTGDGIFVGGANDIVRNCIIANTDYAGGEEAGVFIGGPAAQVIGSTIYNCGRSGIVYRNFPGARILHNIIHDVGLQDQDLGGIYTFGTDGQGAEIGYNQIYNIHTGGYGAAGIFLDNQSANFAVDHNVVWNCDYALKMNPPSTNNLVYNNTLSGTQESLASSGDWSMPGSVFENNIFTSNLQLGPGASQSHNINQSINPQFVDPANGNYQLKPGSPAIDAGLILPPYTNGYIGGAPDAGAYEYGVPAFSVGSSLPLPAAPVSTWNPSDAPPANLQNVNDPVIPGKGGIELGVKFRSDVAGAVLGVRFWKGIQNTGPHSGQLWSATGQLLADASFSDETSSGWQEVDFSAPVRIAASTTYIVAYHTAAAYIAYGPNALATAGINSPPLHVLASGVDGYNGVLQYDTVPGTPAFPASHNNQTPNYWVDVAFVADAAPSTPSPPGSLTATVSSQAVVTLSWSASGGTVTAYHVERSTDGTNFTDIAPNVPTAGYIDASAQPGVSYSYRVRAENAGVFSAYGNVLQITTPGTPLAPAARPAPVSARSIANGVLLNWSAVPQFQTGGAVTYNVYRGTAPGQEILVDTRVGGSAFTDAGLTAGTTYFYQVTSVNAAGESGRSAELSAVAALPGDVDADGAVGMSDLLTLTRHMGTPAGANWSDGDLNGDGSVDLSDWLILVRNFGSKVRAAPTSAPASHLSLSPATSTAIKHPRQS